MHVMARKLRDVPATPKETDTTSRRHGKVVALAVTTYLPGTSKNGVTFTGWVLVVGPGHADHFFRWRDLHNSIR